MFRFIRSAISGREAQIKAMREVEDFRATGSSMAQLREVQEIVKGAALPENERNYFTSEVFPMLEACFQGARQGRRAFFKSQRIALGLTFTSTVLGAVSATPIVSEDIKFYPLLMVAIIGAISTVQQTNTRTRQPALDWLASRLAYDEALAEVVNRITVAGVYAPLPDDNSRFLKMSERIEKAFYSSESKIQAQIRTFQETMSHDVCQTRKRGDEELPPNPEQGSASHWPSP